MYRKSFVLIILVVVSLLITSATMAQETTTPEQGAASPLSDISTPDAPFSLEANLGPTFTYQGRIKKDGNLVNGPCNMAFSLWDAAAAGTQQGTTQSISNVNVSEGLFTVELNDSGQFGPNAFNGQKRYLGISIQCPPSTPPTTLTPRQELTAAPYATHAQHASALYAVDGRPQVNGVLEVNGVDFVLRGRGGGVGNNGGRARALVDGGSSDGLIVNYANDFGKVAINGNVGIGTTNPGRPLEVGNIYVAGDGVIRYSHRDGNYYRSWDVGTGDPGVFGGQDNFGIRDVTVNATRLVISTDGKVGIGTNSPLTKLHVQSPGTTHSTSGFRVSDGGGLPGLEVFDDGTVLIGGLYDTSGQHACLYRVPFSSMYIFSQCSSAAEYVPTIDEGLGYPEAGDLVSILPEEQNPYADEHAPFGVAKTTTANDPHLVGFIIDPDLGADGSKQNDHYLPLAIYGYFPVKVTMENGPIKRGDPITSSSKAGYGMKATQPGRIVGYALEDANAEGKIQVMVQPGDYLGDAPARIESLEAKVLALQASNESLEDQLNHFAQVASALEKRLQSLEGK